jgi:hypothetical protein
MLTIFLDSTPRNPVSGSACASADGSSGIGRNVSPEVEFIEKKIHELCFEFSKDFLNK